MLLSGVGDNHLSLGKAAAHYSNARGANAGTGSETKQSSMTRKPLSAHFWADYKVVYTSENSMHFFSGVFFGGGVAPHLIFFIVFQLPLSYIFQRHLPNVLVKKFAVSHLNCWKLHLLTWGQLLLS